MDRRTILIGAAILAAAVLVWIALASRKGGPSGAPGAVRVAFRGSTGADGPLSFFWTPPGRGGGPGYNLLYAFSLRDPAMRIVATSAGPAATSVLLPKPYTNGTYTIAVVARNQFGEGPYTLATGVALPPPPRVTSFASGWSDGVDGGAWGPVLLLSGGKATAVLMSAVLPGGVYVPFRGGDRPIRDVPLTSADGGTTWTCCGLGITGIPPEFVPPGTVGISRGQTFEWIASIDGPWGRLEYKVSDMIRGVAPNALGAVAFGEDNRAGRTKRYR